MSTLRPYGGTSVARLTTLVNRANRSNLIYGVDFTFGPPTAEDIDEERNTKIEIVPKDTKRYKAADVYYQRLPIYVLNLLPEEFIRPIEIPARPFTIHEVLPKINEALGLDLVPEEVEDTAHDGVSESCLLTLKEGSLTWLPSSVEVAIRYMVDIPLSSIIQVTVLSGLQYKAQ